MGFLESDDDSNTREGGGRLGLRKGRATNPCKLFLLFWILVIKEINFPEKIRRFPVTPTTALFFFFFFLKLLTVRWGKMFGDIIILDLEI